MCESVCKKESACGKCILQDAQNILIKRSFVFVHKSTFLCLYKSLVRSHLDFCDLIWFPVLKKHIRMIENVQRRATRILSALRHLSYSKRLQELNIS